MAVNLTSVVNQFLTPEVIAQIASFLGLDRSAAQKAVGAAVPTMLASLSDLVGTPAGAGQLSKLLSQQQGSPADLLRNSGADGLAQAGSTMLSGLLGGKTTDAMAQALGRFAGTGDSGGKSLLGVIGPIVLGALGQQQREAGLDANGLASLLRSQKDQIVSAIPSGLADKLGAMGLVDRAESGARAAAAATSRMPSASERATAAYDAANKSQWPYWLAALVVVAGLALYAFNRSEQPVAEVPARTAAGTVGMAPADLTVDGVNLANQVNSSITFSSRRFPPLRTRRGRKRPSPKSTMQSRN